MNLSADSDLSSMRTKEFPFPAALQQNATSNACQIKPKSSHNGKLLPSVGSIFTNLNQQNSHHFPITMPNPHFPPFPFQHQNQFTLPFGLPPPPMMPWHFMRFVQLFTAANASPSQHQFGGSLPVPSFPKIPPLPPAPSNIFVETQPCQKKNEKALKKPEAKITRKTKQKLAKAMVETAPDQCPVSLSKSKHPLAIATSNENEVVNSETSTNSNNPIVQLVLRKDLAVNFNSCAVCGESFRLTADLVQHMRSNHRQSRYKRKCPTDEGVAITVITREMSDSFEQ